MKRVVVAGEIYINNIIASGAVRPTATRRRRGRRRVPSIKRATARAGPAGFKRIEVQSQARKAIFHECAAAQFPFDR